MALPDDPLTIIATRHWLIDHLHRLGREHDMAVLMATHLTDEVMPEDDLIVLTLIYMVFVVLASLGLGRWSDRIGRRRVFVFAASGLQADAALLLALVPDLKVAMVAAGLLGAGYGCFLSVDQALATQVLPDAASRGKDLGIMNIASAVPQAIAPLIGTAAVVLTGSFVLVFVLSALFAAAGAFAVARVRSVA